MIKFVLFIILFNGLCSCFCLSQEERLVQAQYIRSSQIAKGDGLYLLKYVVSDKMVIFVSCEAVKGRRDGQPVSGSVEIIRISGGVAPTMKIGNFSLKILDYAGKKISIDQDQGTVSALKPISEAEFDTIIQKNGIAEYFFCRQ
jgi:hypothetical protein